MSSLQAKEKWELTIGHGSAFSPFCLSIAMAALQVVLFTWVSLVVTCGLPIGRLLLFAELGETLVWGTWAYGIFRQEGWNLCPLLTGRQSFLSFFF